MHPRIIRRIITVCSSYKEVGQVLSHLARIGIQGKEAMLLARQAASQFKRGVR